MWPQKAPEPPPAAHPEQAGRSASAKSQAVKSSRIHSTHPHVISSGFLSGDAAPHNRLWLVILNYTLPPHTPHLWKHAHFRVCADGGANRIHDEMPALCNLQRPAEIHSRFIPDAIVGDLDSIRPAVRNLYQHQHRVRLLDQREDQDSTDLQKCIKFVAQEMAAASDSSQKDVIVVTGGVGGRLDHTLANLSTLYQHADLNLVLLGDGNIVRLLHEGLNVVKVNAQAEGRHCGVIPLSGSSVVSSTGLQWDMEELELEFTGMISACNQIKSSEVCIRCSRPCLWMTTVAGVE